MAHPTVEITKYSSDEANVSKRRIFYRVTVNGRFMREYFDVNDALDYMAELMDAYEANNKGGK